MTAQGQKEANNLKDIKNKLLAKGIETPLVADIHFNPSAAEIAAKNVDSCAKSIAPAASASA